MYTDKLNRLHAAVEKPAFAFIKNNYVSTSRNDFKFLKQAVFERTIELRGFSNSAIDLEVFDWAEEGRDRNWWWQMQSLPFLTWFISSFELQSEEERREFFRFCVNSVINWRNKAMRASDSPLAWHDHATAFRVRNVVNWLVFCWDCGLSALVAENNTELDLVSLVEEHLAWLADRENYSIHTNHGFDQSLISYTISLYFGNRFSDYKALSLARLQDELDFAFTPQGVHKENSPGYQKFMLSRLKGLLNLEALGDSEISVQARDHIEKATEFLKVITLPDGMLPIIGDTRWDDFSEVENTKSELNVYDYSDSGYLVVKGRDQQGRDFFLSLKNCHDSNYHRHDDDLSVFFYYAGRVVFGDGGLLSHNEKDAKRLFIRSSLAHSCPVLPLKAIRDKLKVPQRPTMELREGGIFHGVSHMYGVKVERSVDISKIRDGEISILDVTESEGEIWSNFLLTEDVMVKSQNSGFQVSFDSFLLTIAALGEAGSSYTCKGWDPESAENSAIFSKHLGRDEAATRVWLTSRGQSGVKISIGEK
ncbi:hypothetical protein HNP46_003978 [Pseudomonas nitritireducens]|uniref:Heparin-sulfate lyase N-terminal domain-containing protein n=1 Tax=Pseudomonas nitroreducens TaxID=46680 RepID=A0A7W7P3C1_PSENT|nr:heparinase II/III family protein [Pseudomonas nitritireducens]MBB4865102.1 hypothetical protein [Pseudomonas nitritireducens]